MMKSLFVVTCFLLIGFMACERKPYVEHKLKFEKVSEDCKDQQSYFRMVSNFGGERFEFEKCLPADFNKEQLTSTRKGDTVLVTFAKQHSPGTKVFHLTLDIDSYPRYHYITIGGDTYSINTAENK